MYALAESMIRTNQRQCEVLLSLQQALLGEIPPNLRAVTVRYDDTTIHFEAFFDGEIGESDQESMSLVETEVIADFPESHSIRCELIRLDAPAPIPKNQAWVYYRKEPLVR